MYCRKCGKEVEENAEFCPECIATSATDGRDMTKGIVSSAVGTVGLIFVCIALAFAAVALSLTALYAEGEVWSSGSMQELVEGLREEITSTEELFAITGLFQTIAIVFCALSVPFAVVSLIFGIPTIRRSCASPVRKGKWIPTLVCGIAGAVCALAIVILLAVTIVCLVMNGGISAGIAG